MRKYNLPLCRRYSERNGTCTWGPAPNRTFMLLPVEGLMFGVPAIMPDALHRPDVDVSDAQRDKSVAPEQRKRIVVQKKKKHGQDFALGA